MESVPSMRSALLITAGLLAFMLYLYFFVGFDEIFIVLEQLNPVEYAFYYSLTFASILLSVFFYSMAWRELLEALSINVDRGRAFLYCLVANFVDLMVPLEAVTGEAARVYLLYRDSKEHLGENVASVVGHRIISNFFALSALIVSSISLVRYAESPYTSYLLVLVIMGTAASILILLYLAVTEEAAGKLVNALMRLVEVVTRNRLKTTDLRDKAKTHLSFFHRGVRRLGEHPKHLIKAMVYTSISWCFHLAIFFLVFYALGYSGVSRFIPQMVVVYSLSLATQTIPVGLPVGLVEIVMTSLYTLFGVPPAVGGTATTLIRVVTFWFQIMVGYAVVQWMGSKTLFNSKKAEHVELKR